MSTTPVGLQLFDGLDSDPVIAPPSKSTDHRRIYVNFLSEAAVAQYAKLINRSITGRTKEIWWTPGDAKILEELFGFTEESFYEAPPSKKVRDEEELAPDLFLYQEDPGFWELHWQNMPEFYQPDASAVRKIVHYFTSDEEIRQWASLVKQNITKQTSSIWYPHRPKNDVKDLYWITEDDKQ